jgi:hypothetical protein
MRKFRKFLINYSSRVSSNFVEYPSTRLLGKSPSNRVLDTRLGNPIFNYKSFIVDISSSFSFDTNLCFSMENFL